MQIRKLNDKESPPMDLLLLADPSRERIETYLLGGECYAAEEGKNIIGVYVLLSERRTIIELVNLAVSEEYQGKGIGKQLLLHAIQRAK